MRAGLLSSSALVRDFGIRSDAARRLVRVFYEALVTTESKALADWQRRFGYVEGNSEFDSFSQYAGTLARRYGIEAGTACKQAVAHDGEAHNDENPGLKPAALWFALQSCYAAIVLLAAERFVSWDFDDLPGGNPFRWCFSPRVGEVSAAVELLRATIAEYELPSFSADSISETAVGIGPDSTVSCDEADLFKALYQDLFPRRLRHRLGEYYTPDWLARHVLDQVGFMGQPNQRLLDPACGSGTFLMLAIERSRGWGLGAGDGGRHTKCGSDRISPPQPPAPSLQPPIAGCDINPLAVLTARANYVIALRDRLPKDRPVEIPIYLADSILDRPPYAAFDEPFDFVVGNPPWIAWDNLPKSYRQASRSLWQQYGLFSLSGSDARHGGGKKDLSMLMLYSAADRYLKPDGRLGMVITQTLFQTKGAGDGFRRFQLGPEGEPLKVFRVDDMVAIRPFDAANWTSTIFLEKGKETEYPVAYVKWGRGTGGEGRGTGDEGRGTRGEGRGTGNEGRGIGDGGRGIGDGGRGIGDGGRGDGGEAFCREECLASPVDRERIASPWIVLPKGTGSSTALQDIQSGGCCGDGPSDYVAHLGANSGGANGVYWVEVLEETEGGVLIRNLAGKAKRAIETVERVIEPDLLYPLVRWLDVKRYSAVPRCGILLVQDVVSRTGIDETVMRSQYPRTLAYLERFRDLLTARAAYRRYQNRGPFYSMYNVGTYTVSPVKVVWRRMDRQINAAVIETAGVPLLASKQCRGSHAQPPLLDKPAVAHVRPIVPQETCVVIACESTDEAHYLCALLNSDAVNQRVASHSVRNGKGFGTPGMLEYLGLRRFDPQKAAHQELAAQSREAHVAAMADVFL